jgi:phage-related protein (TIGR01555 family)
MNETKRLDGYMNLMSGLNTPGLDRTAGTFSGSWAGRASNMTGVMRARSNVNDLTSLYLSNGLAQKIIDRPSDDCLQRGIDIEEDTDELMSAEYDRLRVITKMADALRWTRLYGGAAILIIAKDGGELTDPLNMDNLDEVMDLRVYDLTCVRGTNQYYEDDNDPTTFGTIEYYEITPWNSPQLYVHETRLIPVAGDPMPGGLIYYNRVPWAGRSNLESCMKDLMRYDMGLEWSLRLLERKQQAVYSMEGLGQMFLQGDDEFVNKRINMVDMVRSNLNSIVVDKNDEYTISSASMDGVQSMIQEYASALSAASNIPETILFGKATSGLNNTGSGDLESYYGMVGHIQESIARPALERLTSVLWVQKSLTGKAPEDWKITFNPLWVPSETEVAQADLYKAQATSSEVTALTGLMNSQVLAPEEVRKIVINKYPDYEFSEELPDFPETDIQYAEGIDPSLLDIPGKAAVVPGKALLGAAKKTPEVET